MPKTVTLRLKDDVYNVFMEAALAENRHFCPNIKNREHQLSSNTIFRA
jgi:hypothetical protein